MSAQNEKALNEMVGTIRGDIDPEIFDDDFVLAWADAQARKDERIRQAFLDRGRDPASYKKVMSSLGKRLEGYINGLPDRKATEDRAAVTAAVRGASKQRSAQSDDDIDFGKVRGLSDNDFELWAKEQAKKATKPAA